MSIRPVKSVSTSTPVGSGPITTDFVGQDGAEVDAPPDSLVGNRSLVLFDSGDEVTVQAGDEGIRFLLVSGGPLEEPVAWYGPIVMNTEQELPGLRRAARRHFHQPALTSRTTWPSSPPCCRRINAPARRRG